MNEMRRGRSTQQRVSSEKVTAPASQPEYVHGSRNRQQPQQERSWERPVKPEHDLLQELQINPQEKGFMERLREKTLPKAVMIASALGFGIPSLEKAFEKPLPATAEEMKDFLMQEFDAAAFTVTTLPDGRLHVREKGMNDPISPLYHREVQRVVIPGQVREQSATWQAEWAGRPYDRPAEIVGGNQPLEQFAQEMAERDFAIYDALGVNPNDAVESIVIVVEGTASPEGNPTKNDEAAFERGVQGGLALYGAYIDRGIDPSKIELYTDSAGVRGTIQDFIDQAEANGGLIPGSSPKRQFQNAIREIRKVHDGRATDPTIIDAHATEIAANRTVEATVLIVEQDIVADVYDDDLNPVLVPPVGAPDYQVPGPTTPGQPIEPPPPPSQPRPGTDGTAREINPRQLKGRTIPPTTQVTVGTSNSGGRMGRGSHIPGQHNRRTGRTRFQQQAKRSSNHTSGGRNGSR